jgi:hypothetical protein
MLADGTRTTISTNLEVLVDDDFTPTKVHEAFQYIHRFEQFAQERMIQLHKEYMSKDSMFFKNCESINTHLFENVNDGTLEDLVILFRYGFASSGQFEHEQISLQNITLPEKLWKEYMRNVYEIKMGITTAKEIKDKEDAKNKRREAYLKLKEEFESE